MEEDSLKDHMVQAHSDKPYKCDYCQAAFRYKGNLASHKTVHTGTESLDNVPFSSLLLVLCVCDCRRCCL